MGMDRFILDRVAQPVADRFMRDDQPLEIAAVLLPGSWAINAIDDMLAKGPVTTWQVGLTALSLLGTVWLVQDLKVAAKATGRGLMNPLRLKWRFLRWLVLVLACLILVAAGLVCLILVMGDRPPKPAFDLGDISAVLLIASAHLGSVNRPSGVYQPRAVPVPV